MFILLLVTIEAVLGNEEMPLGSRGPRSPPPAARSLRGRGDARAAGVTLLRAHVGGHHGHKPPAVLGRGLPRGLHFPSQR